MSYTKPGGQQIVKNLKSKTGEVVESWERKTQLLTEVAFPRPLKGVKVKAREERGEMWKKITDADIQEALFDQSVEKGPGPDILGFKAIRLLWDWNSSRIVGIVRESFRLAIHLRVWKEVRGW
jgi:hypothetical protein